MERRKKRLSCKRKKEKKIVAAIHPTIEMARVD